VGIYHLDLSQCAGITNVAAPLQGSEALQPLSPWRNLAEGLGPHAREFRGKPCVDMLTIIRWILHVQLGGGLHFLLCLRNFTINKMSLVFRRYKSSSGVFWCVDEDFRMVFYEEVLLS